MTAVRAAFRSAFGAFVRWRIARGLDGLWVRGLDAAQEALLAGPVVLAATHVSWWDGMVLFPLDDALGRSTRVWMDADNLRRLPFFGPLGALPLDASGPAGLRRSIRTASGWLDRPGRGLWVFPQGRQRPHWGRPLDLRPGAVWITERLGATLLPVGLGYGFRRAPAPSAVVSFGAPVPAAELEAGLIGQLERIDTFLHGADVPGAPTSEFTLLAGRSRAGDEQGLPARLLARALGSGGRRG